MNNIIFERTNGNIIKSLPNEDHISGLIIYLPQLPEGWEHIALLSSLEQFEQEFGCTVDSNTWEERLTYYHVSEIFRLNPGVKLYLGIYPAPSGTNMFSQVATMQNFAGGKIRQIGIWNGGTILSTDTITRLQNQATTLRNNDTPLSILYAPRVKTVSSLPSNIACSPNCNVSVVIGQDGAGIAEELQNNENPNGNSVTAIGTVLGLLSRAAVHESIGWVAKFPTGIAVPGFSGGQLFREQSKAVIDELDASRYIFFTAYSGLSGTYINDSHTMDDAIHSDYAMIENVRTMDKAVRNIRTYLLPELGSPLYVNPDTGQLQAYTVEHLKRVANKALEDMEKAGELSGYSVDIDPEQNVLSTSEVEFVIKQIGVGVMRRIRVKVGFYDKL